MSHGADDPRWRTVLARPDSVVAREVAGEFLLVPIRGELAQLQNVFVLDPVGAFIWKQLDGSRSLEAVLERLLGEFDVSRSVAKADLLELVAELRQARLIEEVDRSAPAPDHAGG